MKCILGIGDLMSTYKVIQVYCECTLRFRLSCRHLISSFLPCYVSAWQEDWQCRSASADMWLTLALRAVDIWRQLSTSLIVVGRVGLVSLSHIFLCQMSVCVYRSLVCPLLSEQLTNTQFSFYSSFSLPPAPASPRASLFLSTWGKVLCKTHLFLMDFLMNFLAAY